MKNDLPPSRYNLEGLMINWESIFLAGLIYRIVSILMIGSLILFYA